MATKSQGYKSIVKVAFVHDDFVQEGGAEKLFAEIAKIYPDAPIYTSQVNWNKIPRSIDHKHIKNSFIQKFPFAQKFYKALLPLYPLAFESFNFNGFDLVISSTTRFAKSIITQPRTKHICYINSVPRFLYNQDQANQYLSKPLRFMLKPYFGWLKKWDKVSSSRVDLYIANSKNIQKQIKDKYSRDSQVVYPAVDTNWFKVKSSQLTAKEKTVNRQPLTNYYLVVSRLNKWKKIDIAIRAACQLGVNLKIVGTGPDEAGLKKLSVRAQSPEVRCQIQFLGNVTKEELRNLYQNAKALIVTQEEDFGMAIAEAQACGTPAVALRKGGALEIVINGKTGLFFGQQSVNSLKDAISAQSKLKWDVSACRKNALRFSEAAFIYNFKKTIDDYVNKTH